MIKRKPEIKEGSELKRTNVTLSQRLLDHSEDKNRSEALEEAYWAMNEDIQRSCKQSSKENGNGG